MGIFLMISSILFLIGTFWHAKTDWERKKVVILPIEFITILLCFWTFGLFYYVYKRQITFIESTEKDFSEIAVVFGMIAIVIHTITKYLDDRRDLSRTSKRYRFIRFLHIRFSHKSLYASLAILLISIGLAEVNHNLILANPPSQKVVLFSGAVIAYSLYRTIVFGLTWRAEILSLPLFGLFLGTKVERITDLKQTTLPLLGFVILIGASAALIYDKFFHRRVRKNIIQRWLERR